MKETFGTVTIALDVDAVVAVSIHDTTVKIYLEGGAVINESFILIAGESGAEQAFEYFDSILANRVKINPIDK